MLKYLIAGALPLLMAGQAFALPRSLRCDFSEGAFKAWDREARFTRDGLTLVFDSIDVRERQARLIGNAGATDVSVVAAPRMTTFVEITPRGNVNTTTVYESAADMKAVHSRHTGTPENPTLSQMYGFCRAY